MVVGVMQRTKLQKQLCEILTLSFVFLPLYFSFSLQNLILRSNRRHISKNVLKKVRERERELELLDLIGLADINKYFIQVLKNMLCLVLLYQVFS